MAVDDCNRGGDAACLEIMRDDVADCIDDLPLNAGQETIQRGEEFAERFLEELPVLFGKNKHSADLQCVAARKLDIHPFGHL